MKILKTFFSKILLLKIKNFKDNRGDFRKLYNLEIFKNFGINYNIKETFISTSKKGTIRGMHYNDLSIKNNKLIYCNKGKIFDVILDIRNKSNNYGKYISINLEEGDGKLVYIPYGFAHGFQALDNNTEVFYFSSSNFNSVTERGYMWNSFGCKWPISEKNKIILSKRDKKHPNFIKI